LDFLQTEHLTQNSSLIEVLTSGRRRVTKKALKEQFPFSKSFLADFTQQHPEILEQYRQFLGVPDPITNKQLDEDFDECAFSNVLIARLKQLEAGSNGATEFHRLIAGILEFIFYPELIYPEKEVEIDQGRKRIDIVLTNNARDGFFLRRRLDPKSIANKIMIECKNYSNEIGNPELDQLAGRFSGTRGRFGFLIFRSIADEQRLLERCRDNAIAGRGYILPFSDTNIIEILECIAAAERLRIDPLLENRLNRILN